MQGSASQRSAATGRRAGGAATHGRWEVCLSRGALEGVESSAAMVAALTPIATHHHTSACSPAVRPRAVSQSVKEVLMVSRSKSGRVA